MLTVVSLTGLVLMLASTVAAADDLEDLLAEAAEADYAGQQATWCSYGGKTEFSVVTVEHSGSLMMVEAAGSSQVLGGGKTSAVGDENGMALSDWSSVAVADRYKTAATFSEVRLGRDVTVVEVHEDGQVRARIWFDESTGAALGSEIYDDGGALFRLSWMLDFDPNPRRIYTVLNGGASTYDVVVGADADALAADVAGYEQVDTYAGPSDSVHAFYSDGLFSFSVFLIEGEGATGPFVEADIMETDSGTYRWILTPSDLWVQWSGGGLTYVLVGDLPPDHLEEVLAELPAPARGNIFSRIWSGIFG
jgi:hypothetical protein